MLWGWRTLSLEMLPRQHEGKLREGRGGKCREHEKSSQRKRRGGKKGRGNRLHIEPRKAA